MAIDILIDRLKEQVGIDRPRQVYPVETGMIQRFAQAVDDSNPCWQDEEYAAHSSYGGVVAPPTFALILGFDSILKALTEESEVTVLHGSTNIECFESIRPGDIITLISKVVNVRERSGKTGRAVFVTFETTCSNQRQEVVAQCRQMAIIY